MRPGLDLKNPDELAHTLHVHLHGDSESERRANLWALIAANAHTVAFDYRRILHFIEWANSYQLLTFVDSAWMPLPQPDAIDYLEILEFRLQMLKDAETDPKKEWHWPTEWGHVHWNCPVAYSANAGEPWASPRFDDAINETAEAMVLLKRDNGHGQPISLSTTEALLTSEMINLFVSSPIFIEVPLSPPIRLSLDVPPRLRRAGNDGDREFDTDRLLGDYTPGRQPAIVIYERGLRHCARQLNLPMLALRELVILHETAHWLSDQVPLRRATSIDNHERWSDSRFETADGTTKRHPSGLQETDLEVHEGWAQVLTFYSLLMAYDDRLRNSVSHPSLRDYIKHDGRGCLHAFLELNEHQSPPYHVWRDVVASGKTPREVVQMLPDLRAVSSGATLALWRTLLA